MTVYILAEANYDGDSIIDVYASEEAAQAKAAELNDHGRSSNFHVTDYKVIE